MDELLREMVEQGASDLHLSCGTVPILRVDGSVREMKEKESIDPAHMIRLLLSIAPQRNRDQFLHDRDADFAYAIEDPVKFVHPHKKCLVNQREVGVHTSSFKAALRAALREDPDERQEQVRTMPADSLRAVISQTLCKKIGGGRIAAQEILLGLPSVSNLIHEGKTFQIENAMQTGRKQGMWTLNDHLVELVKNKLVAPMEAYLKSVDKHMVCRRHCSGRGSRSTSDRMEKSQIVACVEGDRFDL